MDIKKLLGLLFEHLEAGEIERFSADGFEIHVDFKLNTEVIELNKDLLTQYNELFT